MKKLDPALKFSNPRLLAAVYYGLLSVVGTLLIDAFLIAIGVEEVIPLFDAVVLGMLVAGCMGAIFGERIIHCSKPYLAKTFWLGFSMVIVSLPVFDLGLVLFMQKINTHLFSVVKFHDMVLFYFVVVGYSYVLFGFSLAIACGLASMYLRGRLVYDIMHTQRQHRTTHHALAKHKARPHHKVH